MSKLQLIATFLLDNWQVVTTIAGAALTGFVTKDWSAAAGVAVTGLTAIAGRPKAAQFSARIKRRS